MSAKLFSGLFSTLGLLVAGFAIAADQPKSCCDLKLACCDGPSTCCGAEAKLECCAKGQKCCIEGLACCEDAKACCGPKKTATSDQSSTSAKRGCCNEQAGSVDSDTKPGCCKNANQTTSRLSLKSRSATKA